MTVYLSIGSNLGCREDNLNTAITEIGKRIGTIVSQSAFLQTTPWGFASDNYFLNACVGVDTTLTPTRLLRATQQIELDMGRTEKTKDTYQDRIIDIDILLYGRRQVRTKQLQIPHPLMAKRLFVLEPLAQIAENEIVPGSRMSVGEMLKALETRS